MDQSELLDELVVALAELGVPVRTDGDALVADLVYSPDLKLSEA